MPFIGAYTITDSTGKVLEMNLITADAALADDNDTSGETNATFQSDDTIEQIGRFCPIVSTQLANTEKTFPIPMLNPTTTSTMWVDPYGWASHIFDNFTVLHNPQDDYLPNVDPIKYYTLWDTAAHAYPPATLANLLPSPQPVPNMPKSTPTAAGANSARLKIWLRPKARST